MTFHKHPNPSYYPFHPSDSSTRGLVVIQATRASGDFVLIFQCLISEVIPSQKCHEHESDSQRLRSFGWRLKIVWRTQNTITDVPPAWWGTAHFSPHVTEYLNEQIRDRWIDRGGPQNWPLQSPDPTHPRFPRMGVTWKTRCVKAK
jgi:hypothetical protein